jgi:hypothetical protein
MKLELSNAAISEHAFYRRYSRRREEQYSGHCNICVSLPSTADFSFLLVASLLMNLLSQHTWSSNLSVRSWLFGDFRQCRMLVCYLCFGITHRLLLLRSSWLRKSHIYLGRRLKLCKWSVLETVPGYQLCYALNITVVIGFGDCFVCSVYQLCRAVNIKMLCIIVIVAVQNSGSQISPCHVSLSL